MTYSPLSATLGSSRFAASSPCPRSVENLAVGGKPPATLDGKQEQELRRVFNQFVGETFYGQLLSAMRKTVGRPAYFHGGRTEEVFQAQLDQVLGQRMAEASADSFTKPMFDLFCLSRKS